MFLTLCLDDATVETTRCFYERLGLSLAAQKHGEKGLLHYSAVMPSVSVEVYPTLRSLPPEDRLFIGLVVDEPESVKAKLVGSYGGRETEPPIANTKSGIVTLRDQNGILVRLFPRE